MNEETRKYLEATGRKLVKHAGNTRIPCICQVRTAKMMYLGNCIGTISEERNDAGEYKTRL